MLSTTKLTPSAVASTVTLAKHAAFVRGVPRLVIRRCHGTTDAYGCYPRVVPHNGLPSRRAFSSTAPTGLKEYFPPPSDAPHIKLTGPAWPHPIYSEQQMKDIKVAHRQTKNWADWVALSMVRVLRTGMDFCTGYRHDKEVALAKKDPTLAKQPRTFAMTERKWLVRFVFLESVAGVPGMVGGMLRHLHSLRRMKRDNGWIETLLEEAYNERMHLLTFLKMAEPGWFMRFMLLGAQGVFFNAMFVSYLISPRSCHRFVGYLEEEAVLTYTRAINDIDAGKLPKWNDLEAPEIAVRYWNMPEGHRKMRDLLLYIRADEAKHREVNHTLGNLDQNMDPNPFVSTYKAATKDHPSKGIEHLKPMGWERDDVI
ncbi:MAG: Alternative oxidase, mitochondrial precursor [Thelocarpon superellum]|nr:MAG: Alternative oxidase, mitochondrial precursor [Thelocarpon superellum]